jgi:hypothetical protein
LGFVGVIGAVVALIELYEGEAGLLAALAWIFGGAWLAALSWRRAKLSLDRLDHLEDTPEAVTSQVAAPQTTTYPGWDRREVSAPQVRG